MAYHQTAATQVPEVLEAIVFPQYPEAGLPDPVRLEPLPGSAEAGLEEGENLGAKALSAMTKRPQKLLP